MDENLNNNKTNNGDNPNFNNNQQPNSDFNNQVNPVEQNTEENPYYNPYFQGNDISNSPYMDGMNSDSSNNDVYNQSYMNMYSSGSNNQEMNDVQNTNIPENNQVDDSINLFDMDNDDQSLNNNSTVDNMSTQNNIPVQDNMPTQNDVLAQDNVPTQENPSLDINPILNTNFNTLEADNQSDFNMSGNIETDQQSIDNSQFNSNQTAQNTYGSNNDEEFKKSWMGKLYDKANHRKFSIPAFFFGGLYYLYRKLYLFGFVFLLISCIIPIIGMYAISSSLTSIPTNTISSSNSSFIVPILLTAVLPIIINIIYAFAFYPLYKSNINKKLAKYKNETQNPAQLLDTAKQKGGTSIPLVLVGILLNAVICGVALTTIMSSLISGFMEGLIGGLKNPQNELNSNTLANDTSENQAIYDIYNFYNDYYFEYDASKWLANEDKNLSYENYTLAYIQSIENLTSVGFDINQNDGRASFFTYLYNLFSSQIDATNTTLELGSSSFVYDNGIYYSFIDLVYTASIERCYFVLIPENDIFIEFILSNNDTVISDEIHDEVVSYICSIQEEQVSDTTGNINTDVVNGIDSNNVNIPSSETNSTEPQNSATNLINNTEPQISANNTTENNPGGLTIVSNTANSNVAVMFNTAQ